MQLYGFFRSSAAFRVRIALNLKSVAYDTIPVNLRSGDHLADDYRAINPQGRVPSLIDGDDVLIQSMAIIEYLDETHPEPPFLPADAVGRARVRGLANIIACDIHPLNNSGVLEYLKNQMQIDADNLQRWYRNWVALGFEAFEALVAGNPASGRFCHGDTPGLADICLVPQVFNAKRFDCDLAPYPVLMGMFDGCMEIGVFEAAQPANQPDAAE